MPIPINNPGASQYMGGMQYNAKGMALAAQAPNQPRIGQVPQLAPGLAPSQSPTMNQQRLGQIPNQHQPQLPRGQVVNSAPQGQIWGMNQQQQGNMPMGWQMGVQQVPQQYRGMNPAQLQQQFGKPIPSFKKGGVMKKTGLAYLHKGEKVLTAAKTKALQKRK